jgi:cytochrome c553
MKSKSSFKTGEKILFAIVAAIMVFAVITFVALEYIRSHKSSPMYPATTFFDFSPEGLKGSETFRRERCTTCHRAMRNGTNQGIDLDGIGSRQSYDQLYAFLRQPEKHYEKRTVDHGFGKEAGYVANLPDEELKAMARFLSELKARQGSADAPMPPEHSSFIDEMVKVWAPDSWKAERHDVRQDTK